MVDMAEFLVKRRRAQERHVVAEQQRRKRIEKSQRLHSSPVDTPVACATRESSHHTILDEATLARYKQYQAGLALAPMKDYRPLRSEGEAGLTTSTTALVCLPGRQVVTVGTALHEIVSWSADGTRSLTFLLQIAISALF